MKGLRVGALLLLSTPGWAAYQYYLTDNLNSTNASNWSTTGSVGASSLGLTGSGFGSSGGSLISRIPIPDGTSEAEVRATLKLGSSGGSYTTYLQASADAATSGNGSGSFLAFEMQNPQFDADGGCTANFVVLQSTRGVVSLLSSFVGACRDGMVLRMAVHGSAVLVWPDQDAPMEFVSVTPGAGQPGIGTHGAPSGNAISQVQLGIIQRAAPAAVDSHTLAVSAFPRHVDLQWKPATAASTSIGFAGYWIYRDGLYFRRTKATTFFDETVSPGEQHTYAVYSVDQHYNFSSAASVTVTVPPFATLTGTPPPLPGGVHLPSAAPRTAGMKRELEPLTAPPPPNGAFDPRRVGVMALGSYWGTAGEQIDTLSRNLNFSVPLAKPISAGGWSAPFGLSYNSQMWRRDSAATWLIGQDVGYGLGWKVQAGAVVPIWSNSQIVYYLYVDSTGAEYRLDHVTNGYLWTSTMGTYVTFDATACQLHFTDGSFWTLGSVSVDLQDNGTLYPTIMEDSNGNQIQISYLPGWKSSSPNSSARINVIADARSTMAYQFSYTQPLCSGGQCFAHLASISNSVGTAENYTFAYAANQSLVSPFDNSAQGTWVFLQSAGVTGLGIAHQFQCNGSGEITQLTTPLGGQMNWTYRSFTYGTGVSLREVQSRSLSVFAGVSWSFWGDDSYDATQPFHYWTATSDGQTGSYKQWVFYPNSHFYTVPSGADTVALLTDYVEYNTSTSRYSLLKAYWYTTDQLGQPYASTVATYPDYGVGYWYTVTNQTLDTYGNLTQAQVFDYGNTSQTPTRTYNLTYLTNPSYTSLYIRNRLASSTVTTSAGNTTLVSNTYDSAALQPASNAPLHDSNYGTSFTTRGIVTTSVNLGTTVNYQYYVTGAVYQTSDATGNTTNISLASIGALPGVLTPDSNSYMNSYLANTLTYATSFAVTSVTGPNGASSSTTYDTYGRPSTSTIPDGAVTNYTYAYYNSGGQNSQTATVNNGMANQWQKTVLDGFGRTISVLTGNGSTTVSETDTQSAPAGSSPFGKASAVSMPYAPGQTPVWTHYTYDSSGRTLTVVKPDGASTTTYSYAGNQTTTTDPAGKWKTFNSDTFGNLITVTEPDPASTTGGTVVTGYTYNSQNQLTQVSMPRAGATQTRSFQWTGADLTSATNPENGTVTYTYDGAHHLLTRTDARQKQTQYTYDMYGRLYQVQHGTLSGGVFTADPAQFVTYYWDASGVYGGAVSNYAFPANSNTWGRLAGVSFANSGNPSLSTYSPSQVVHLFAYNQAGRVTVQDLRLISLDFNPRHYRGNDVYATYTWDALGKMTSMSYPLNGPQNTMTYDAMSNLTSVSQAPCQTSYPPYNYYCWTWGTPTTLASASYNLVGQLTTLNYPGGFGQETRGYNSMLQLTSIASPQVNMTYTYSPTQNNGRIVSSSDALTGENVSYTYDSLNRLIAAATTGTAGVQWGESYSFDGFGNLTSKVVTKGTAPQVYPHFNSATNQEWTLNDNGFDAAGNWLGPGPSNPYSWNVENQLVSQGYVDSSGNQLSYTYDPSGKRVLKYAQTLGYTYPTTCAVDFYSITGQRLGAYTCNYTWSGPSFTQVSINQFFGSRELVPMDRLGSVRYNQNGSIAYWPWGEERTTTASGTEKFGTYFRDTNGIDYASARYFTNNFGRFLSPDPAGLAAVNPTNPQSWNRYAYVVGDPVNGNDPLGLDAGPCLANAIPAITQTGPMACNSIGYTAWSQGWTSWSNDPTTLTQGGSPGNATTLTNPVDFGAVDETVWGSYLTAMFWSNLAIQAYLDGNMIAFENYVTSAGSSLTWDATTDNLYMNVYYPIPVLPPGSFSGARPPTNISNPGNPLPSKCLNNTHPDPSLGGCVPKPGPTEPIRLPQPTRGPQLAPPLMPAAPPRGRSSRPGDTRAE